MLPLYRIPKKISQLLAELEMFFTLPQWTHMQTLLLSLLITPFKPTIVGQSRVIAHGVHRTKHNEFCQKHDDILVKILRFYAVKLISSLYRKGKPLYIILDDSKAKNRGKHVQGAAKMFDHVSKCYLWGHQFVCVTLSYRHFIHERKRSVSIGKQRYCTMSQHICLPEVGEGTLVISQVKGRKKPLAIFSTQLQIDVASIISIYWVRWSIEVFFKLSKQYLDLTAYHHRDEHALRSHLQLVLLAYCLLTHLFIDELRAQGKPLTKYLLRKFSLRVSQSHIRSLVTIDALDFFKEQAHFAKEDPFDTIKSHLLAA